MICQNIGLAGALAGALAGSETHARAPGWISTGAAERRPYISALLAAFTAALTVEDVIPPADVSAADDIRAVIEALRQMTREAIEAAILTPGDAFSRAELLDHAVDFDGVESPLAARCAQALADAIVPPIVVTAA